MAYTPSSNPLQTGQFGPPHTSRYQPQTNVLQDRNFDPQHFEPKAFKDTAQGQKYKQVFSQADRATRDNIAQHLISRAQQGDKKAYDQLQAIKDVITTPTANPVKTAGAFKSGLLSAASNLVSPGGGITKAAGMVGGAVLKPATDFAAANNNVKHESSAGKQLVDTLKSTGGFIKSIGKTGYQNSPVGAAEQNVGKLAAEVVKHPVSLPGVGKQTSYTSDIKGANGVGGKALAALGDLAGLAYGTAGAKQLVKAGTVGTEKVLSKSLSNATKTNLGQAARKALTPPPVKVPVSAAEEGAHGIPVKVPTKVPIKTSDRNIGTKTNTVDDAEYQRQAANLAKQYDKETKGITQKGSLIRTARQNQIDSKYQDLQAKLDDSYGRTTIKFHPETQKRIANIAKTLHDEGHANLSVSVAKAKTPTQLQKVLESPEATRIAASPQSVDVTQPIPSTGVTKPSKLSSSVSQKAIEQKLTTGLSDLPEYNQVNMKEQAKHASDLISQDHPTAVKIATGELAPPSHVLPESVFTAVENKALKEGDVATLQALANGSRSAEATAMGQRIRALAERDPESAVGNMQRVTDARRAALQAKTGKSPDKAITEATKEIQSAKRAYKPKVTRQTWDDFVESIRC